MKISGARNVVKRICRTSATFLFKGLHNAVQRNSQTMTKEKEPGGPHILMVIIPASGHAALFIQFLYLLRHHRNVTVTVVCGGPMIAEIAKLHKRGDFNDLHMHFESIFGPPPRHSDDPEVAVQAALASAQMESEFQAVKRRLIEEKGTVGAPTSLISDLLLWWTKGTADELGIPWYSVSTSPTWFMLYEFEPQYASLRATGLLVNSAFEAEGTTGSLEALVHLVEQRKKSDPGKPFENTQVIPIGPMAQISGFGVLSTLEDKPSESLKSLDRRDEGSVLYIAFGSECNLTADETFQLASGLEESGVPFLWVLKPPSGQTIKDLLPEGFQARTQGRGFIETGWAPQARILLHPATGGFLTHCGWNSTLESLCAGVPMITWPISADQPMNARFVTDIQKVGVPVRDGPPEEYFNKVTKEDVTSAVRRLMVSDEAKEIKRNSLEMKRLLSQTVGEGGSSYVMQRNFINDLLTV
ncbi:hypothetical protein R1flu_027968 [Riccia fluitans]|uniref:Glycosyltransferase n=1 Tax=Riccia fluitans TaxID=41844 RepID=A0ABD1XKB8_9MARC